MLRWIPGHKDIDGNNEGANEAANQAAQVEGRKLTPNVHRQISQRVGPKVSCHQGYYQFTTTTLKDWNALWNSQIHDSNQLHRITHHPNVTSKDY